MTSPYEWSIYQTHGSNIVWLTNFPNFSSIFFHFLVFFFQCSNSKYSWIKTHREKMKWNYQKFKSQKKIKNVYNSLTFPVFCVKFPDFFNISKIRRLLLENVLLFSQVLHSMWEPWNIYLITDSTLVFCVIRVRVLMVPDVVSVLKAFTTEATLVRFIPWVCQHVRI